MARWNRSRPFWYWTTPGRRRASDIDEELDEHLARRAADLERAGMAPERAHAAARREFGDLEATRRYCQQQGDLKERQMRRGLLIEDFTRDAAISLRTLRRAPLLALTIIATVGLGIGAATAMFAVVDAALLRPLPYADPSHLVRIYTDSPPHRFRFSVADYQALEAQQTAFTQVAAYTDRTMAFSGGDQAERIRARLVTWRYFDLLGIGPAAGRVFTAADGRPGAPGTAVLSRAFFEQRLGGRSDAIGRPIRLDGADYTVVGVLAARVGPLERDQDVFVAAQFQPPSRRGPFFLITLGRLPSAPGAATKAAAELHALDARLFPVWKSSYQDERATWSLMDLRDALAGNFRGLAGLGLGAVALVWLIASVNASNLLVARVASRRRELAVRTALGASRARIVRYLLAESAVLTLASALAGWAIAAGGVAAVRHLAVDFVPRADEIHLAGRALWLLAGLTGASALIFGLLPALQDAGGQVDDGRRSLGRAATANAAARRLRAVLVATQFAVATPLLIAAGLLLASLNQLRHVDLGFPSHNLLTASIQLPMATHGDAGRVVDFWTALETRVAAIPGVTGVAFADSRPPNDADDHNNFDLEAAPTPAGRSQPVTAWVSVTPAYFRVTGVKLVAGRFLDARDAGDGPSTIVVDQSWAARFFGARSAVGQRLKGGGCVSCDWTTIVGVVSDVHYDGLDAGDPGVVYQPIPERGAAAARSMRRYLLVRTAVAPSAIVAGIREALRAADPAVPLAAVATIDDLVGTSLAAPRAVSLLLVALAAVALLLSAVAIYGVMAHYVQQHAKEISIRLALGGRPAAVLRMMLGRGLSLVAVGVIVGVGIALASSRLVATQLYGVRPTDPLTFVAVSLAMVGVAALACWRPAARAVQAEPAAVLRAD